MADRNDTVADSLVGTSEVMHPLPQELATCVTCGVVWKWSKDKPLCPVCRPRDRKRPPSEQEDET